MKKKGNLRNLFTGNNISNHINQSKISPENVLQDISRYETNQLFPKLAGVNNRIDDSI